MWGKLTSLASVVTGQDDSEEEETDQTLRSGASTSKDVDDHEMQLVEQQKLIIQLKDMIRDRENSIIEKDNELKKVSADFSRFKLQSKSKIAGLGKQIQENQRATSDALERASIGSDESVSTSASEVSSSGLKQKLKAKLSVVRKQLQSKEKQLQDLNEQLEKKNQEVEAKERVLTEKDDELKKLKEESSKKNLGISDEKAEETKKQLQIRLEEMITQLSYKDNKILELVNQISEREGGAMDLQECLAEKDEVIKGRDQAIELLRTSLKEHGEREANLTATIDRMKWKQDDLKDNVEKLKEELKRSIEVSRGLTFSSSASVHETEKELEEVTDMREKFSALLAEEKANSASALEKMKVMCDLRYHELEGQLTECGAARDALLSKVEELEGLLESMSQDHDDLKRKIKATEEAESEEGSTKSKFSKFKALAGSKIKALEKEVEALKEQNNDLIHLRDRVAELEEEKGNLQLQIFDNEEKLSKKEMILTQLDDMRQQCEDFLLEINNLRDKNSILEGVAKKQDETLIRLREAEKARESALIRAEEQEATIKCLEARFEGLRRQLEERMEMSSRMEKENSTIKLSHDLLERKVKESEEELSRLMEMNKQLKGSVESTDGDLFVFQKTLDDLQMENKSLRSHVSSLQGVEEGCKKLEEHLKEKSSKLENVQRLLFEKNKLLEDASIRLIDAVDGNSLLSQELEDKGVQIQVLKDRMENLLRDDEKNVGIIKNLTSVNEELREKLTLAAVLAVPTPTFEHFESSCGPFSENVMHDAPSKRVVVLPVEVSDGCLQKDLEETKQEMACLKDLLKSKEEALELLRRELKDTHSLQSELEMLKSSLDEKNHSLEELRLQNEKLIQNNLSLERLEGELLEKDETIKTLKLKHSSFDGQNTELNTLLASKDEIIKNLLADSEMQSIKLQERESALNDFKQKLDDVVNKSITLENSLLSAQNDLLRSQSESDELKQFVENLSKLLKERNEELSISLEKQQEFDHLLVEFDATVLKLKESHQEMHNSNEEIKRLEENLSKMTSKCESLKQQNDQLLESQLSNSNVFEQKLEKSSNDLAKSIDEIQNLEAKIVQLENSNGHMTNELSQKEDLLIELSEALEQSKRELREFKSTVTERNSEVDIERIISKEAQHNLDKSLEDSRESKNELAKSQHLFCESREVESEKLNKSSFDNSGILSATMVESNVALQQLAEKLSNSRIEATELRENVKLMEKKLLDKEKKIQSLSDILEEEEAQLVTTKEELEKLKKLQEEAISNLRIKDEEITKYAETLKEKEIVIKKYLAIMKRQKDSLRQAKEDLNNSSNVDDEELKKLKEKILTLEQELTSLKKDSTALDIQLNQSQKSILDVLATHLNVQKLEDIEVKVKTLLAIASSEESYKIKSESIECELQSIKTKLDEVLKEKESLQQQLASQKIAFETSEKSLESQKLEIEASSNILRDALTAKEELINSLMTEKDFVEGEIMKLRGECSSLEERLGSFKTIYESELSEVKKRLATEKKAMLEEHQENITKLDLEHQQQMNSLISELESSQRSLSNFKKEVEVLTEKINELKRIHEADVEHFVRTKQENEVENLKLASQISDIASGKLLLEGRIAELTKELFASSERSDNMLRENQLYKEKIQEMEVVLANLGDDKDKAHEEISLYQSSIEQLKLELLNAVKGNNELVEKHTNLTEKMEKLQLEKSDVTLKMEEMSRQFDKIIKEKESFQITMHDMKMEVEKLQHSSDQDHPSVSHLRESLEACENSKQDLEREVGSLRIKLSEKVKQNENISKQLQGEMKKLEILEIEFEERRLENQQITETNEELKTKLQDMKKFIQESTRRKEELSKTVDCMSREMTEKDLKIKFMDESLKKALAESETNIIGLNQKINLLEKEKNELLYKGNLDESNQSDVGQLEGVPRLKREVERLELELVKVKDHSTTEMKALQVQFDLLSNDVVSYQHLITKLEINKKNLESQMNEVKPMMTKLKEELKKQEADKLHLRQSISSLEAEKVNLIAEINGLRQRVKMAEDLEDNLEQDYKLEVNIYKEKLKEMEEALSRSQKAEEELNEVNNKLLQHNNALIKNSEDLYDQLSQSRSKEITDFSSSDVSGSISTLTKERDHFKFKVDELKAEIELLKNELKSSKSRQLEIPLISPAIPVPERLSLSSHQTSALHVQEDVDVPRVHSIKSLHSGLHGEPEENATKSMLGSLSCERDSLLERLAESEKKFSEKETELSEFYQQYQLLYQQFSAVQQHLIALQEEKTATPLPQGENASMIPYEKYKDLESLNRQLKEQHKHLERQLQVEQERRLEVEEGMKVIRDQYEQHRMLQSGGASIESHSIPIFSDAMEEDERRVLPQDASLYVQLRHRCLQFKRILMRMDQSRYSLGTIYRYRSHLWKFLIFYFIFIHLFILFRCWA